jgi:hypothetical protein
MRGKSEDAITIKNFGNYLKKNYEDLLEKKGKGIVDFLFGKLKESEDDVITES